MLAGNLYVEIEDGTALDLHPGDVFVIPPHHDAWVVGDEAVRLLTGAARPGSMRKPREPLSDVRPERGLT